MAGINFIADEWYSPKLKFRNKMKEEAKIILEKKNLREIVLRLYEKGCNWEKIKYSDDLYDATQDELQICFEAYNELREYGIKDFEYKQ